MDTSTLNEIVIRYYHVFSQDYYRNCEESELALWSSETLPQRSRSLNAFPVKVEALKKLR